jgi:hypothetical protein
MQITLVTPTPYVFLPKGDGILDRSNIYETLVQEEFVSYSRYSNRSNNCRRRVYRERFQFRDHVATVMYERVNPCDGLFKVWTGMRV